MRNKILPVFVMTLLASASWADQTSRTNKHEAAGVGSGLVVGAAVGGPVGAIVGAALGGWFGDRFNHEKTARLDLEDRYGRARAESQQLQAETQSLGTQLRGDQQRIAALQAQLQSEEQAYRAALQQALDTQIFFRTGESQIHQDSLPSIARMAALISTLDGFVVGLEGHADARGEETYNEALSAARADAVKAALIAAGVSEDRISTSAVGESYAQASENDVDALAMERRVHVQLIGLGESRRVAQQ